MLQIQTQIVQTLQVLWKTTYREQSCIVRWCSKRLYVSQSENSKTQSSMSAK